MGIYLPNLCHFYKNKKVAGGHGKIPRQAQNLRKKHPRRQICLFRTHEGQRLHGRELTLSLQIPLQQFLINDL